MAELVKPKVTEVGTVNPVEDFRDMLGQKDQDLFNEGLSYIAGTKRQFL